MEYIRGNFQLGLIYKYDSKGKKTDEYLVYPNDFYTHHKYEYLPNQIDKYRIYKKEPRVKSESAFLDSLGNVIKTIFYYHDGSIMGETTVYIDEKSFVGPLFNFNGEEIFTYENYDDKENWQIRKSFVDNIPHSITYRKIEYKNGK